MFEESMIERDQMFRKAVEKWLNGKTPKKAYLEEEKASQLLYIAGILRIEDKKIASAMLACVEHLVPDELYKHFQVLKSWAYGWGRVSSYDVWHAKAQLYSPEIVRNVASVLRCLNPTVCSNMFIGWDEQNPGFEAASASQVKGYISFAEYEKALSDGNY